MVDSMSLLLFCFQKGHHQVLHAKHKDNIVQNRTYRYHLVGVVLVDVAEKLHRNNT
jgi:hypothetical protein